MLSAQEKASWVNCDGSLGFTEGLPLHPHQDMGKGWRALICL